MISVTQLGYLVLGVSDLDRWEQFATNILGAAVEGSRASVEKLSGPLFIRLDDYHYRLVAEQSSADDVACIGWEVANAAALESIAEQIAGAGAEVSRGSEVETSHRRALGLISFRDLNGIAMEVFYGPLMADTPFRSPRAISGFRTGPLGLGHCVVTVNNLAASVEFYIRALGMRLSDFITVAPRPGLEIRLAFLHCNPRHHTLALIEQPDAPKKLNHLMLEMNSLDDVGSTLDLCREKQVPIAAGLGRHTNDHMVSFYLATPSGFSIEYGWGGRNVNDATWEVQHYTSGSIWGHHGLGRPVRH